MLFNSYRFLFAFLPIAMLGFHLLGRYGRRPVIAWLALCSVYFYAVWNPVFVLLLVGSIIVNYAVAWGIASSPEESSRRQRLLILGVTLNLLALFYFKYLYKTLLLLKALHLAPHPSAHRHLLLHLHADFLPGRPRPRTGRAPGLPLLPALRHLLSTPHHRPHPPSQRDDAPIRAHPRRASG
jgi:hypothetical protein